MRKIFFLVHEANHERTQKWQIKFKLKIKRVPMVNAHCLNPVSITAPGIFEFKFSRFDYFPCSVRKTVRVLHFLLCIYIP